jgi:hypothetical protein
MAQLLCETQTFTEAKIVLESQKAGGYSPLAMSGIFMQAEVVNGNGRFYPRREIENAVAEFNDRLRQSGGKIMGECNHPSGMEINLDRVSHVITELRMEGNNAVGRLQLLETPLGKIVRTLLESGVRLGVSSRGVGDILPGNRVANYSMVTIDIVATPSAPNAYPKPILESLQMTKYGNRALELAEAVLHDKKAQKFLTNEISRWINENLKWRK